MLRVNDYVKWEEGGFVWVGRIRSISASGNGSYTLKRSWFKE